jgi:hypothetical protein
MAKGMEGAFSSFFQSIFDNTKSWKDKMAGLFKGLADSFIKALSDMAAKWLVSGLFGGSSSGGGTGWLGSIIGLVGGLFGGGGGGSGFGIGGQPSQIFQSPMAIPSYQHGGSFWVNKGTHFIAGEGSEPELVQVTPRSKMPTANQSISVGPINIQMEKGQGLNPAILKKDIETAIIEVIKRHM